MMGIAFGLLLVVVIGSFSTIGAEMPDKNLKAEMPEKDIKAVIIPAMATVTVPVTATTAVPVVLLANLTTATNTTVIISDKKEDEDMKSTTPEPTTIRQGKILHGVTIAASTTVKPALDINQLKQLRLQTTKAPPVDQVDATKTNTTVLAIPKLNKTEAVPIINATKVPVLVAPKVPEVVAIVNATAAIPHVILTPEVPEITGSAGCGGAKEVIAVEHDRVSRQFMGGGFGGQQMGGLGGLGVGGGIGGMGMGGGLGGMGMAGGFGGSMQQGPVIVDTVTVEDTVVPG